jgi:hypothetical protein
MKMLEAICSERLHPVLWEGVFRFSALAANRLAFLTKFFLAKATSLVDSCAFGAVLKYVTNMRFLSCEAQEEYCS